MQRNLSVELRVGIFVLVALLIGTALAFVIGNRSNLWQRKAPYHAEFANVDGLRAGSPVLIGGVNVGTVSEVTLREDGRIDVALHVVDSAQHLVRADGEAIVGNKGLLGDKLVQITVGSGDVLPPGSAIPTSDAKGMAEYMAEAGGLIEEAEGALRNVRVATDPLGDEAFGENIRETAENVARLSRAAADNRGTVRRLLEDEELGARIAAAITNLERLTAELAATGRGVRAIVDEVRNGDGSAHALVYGEDGARLVSNLADATGELAVLMREVRTGDGMAHDLLYEREGAELVDNLTESSEHLAAIMEDVRAGRGTLGGLLTDPSVYEDMKRLLGDMERNEILRALVRYSIRRDETPPEPPRVAAD